MFQEHEIFSSFFVLVSLLPCSRTSFSLTSLFFSFLKVANEVVDELNLKPEDVYLGQGSLLPYFFFFFFNVEKCT